MRYESSRQARSFVQNIIARGLASPDVRPDEWLRRRGVPAEHIAVFAKTAIPASGTSVVPADMRPFADAFRGLVAQRYAFDSITWLPAPAGVTIMLETPGDAVMVRVEEGRPIPVSGLAGDPIRLGFDKLASIVAVTAELLKQDDPGVTATVERFLTRATGEGTDAAAFDPTLTGSLTASATEISWTDNLKGDMEALLAAISNGTPSRPHIVLGAATARTLLFSGEAVFLNVALSGRGSIGNIPTLTSPSERVSNYAIALDADAIMVSDRGIEIDRASAGALQLNDAPSEGASTLVSLWQANTTAFRVLRFLSWAKRDDAVAFLETPTGSPS